MGCLPSKNDSPGPAVDAAIVSIAEFPPIFDRTFRRLCKLRRVRYDRYFLVALASRFRAVPYSQTRVDISWMVDHPAGPIAFEALCTASQMLVPSVHLHFRFVQSFPFSPLLSQSLGDLRCPFGSLNFSGCLRSEESCLMACRFSATSRSLKSLDLSFNHISAACLKSLREWLESRSCSLERMHLRYCQLDDAGIAVLAFALQGNASLRQLDISDNPGIMHSGFQTLMTCLVHNCSLSLVRVEAMSLPGFVLEGLKGLASRNRVCRDVVNEVMLMVPFLSRADAGGRMTSPATENPSAGLADIALAEELEKQHQQHQQMKHQLGVYKRDRDLVPPLSRGEPQDPSAASSVAVAVAVAVAIAIVGEVFPALIRGCISPGARHPASYCGVVCLQRSESSFASALLSPSVSSKVSTAVLCSACADFFANCSTHDFQPAHVASLFDDLQFCFEMQLKVSFRELVAFAAVSLRWGARLWLYSAGAAGSALWGVCSRDPARRCLRFGESREGLSTAHDLSFNGQIYCIDLPPSRTFDCFVLVSASAPFWGCVSDANVESAILRWMEAEDALSSSVSNAGPGHDDVRIDPLVHALASLYASSQKHSGQEQGAAECEAILVSFFCAGTEIGQVTRPASAIWPRVVLAEERDLAGTGVGHLQQSVSATGNRDRASDGLLFLLACSTNDVEKASNLLGSKAVDVDFRDHDDRTGLHVAAANGCLDSVRLLLDQQADVTLLDRFERTPLDEAARNGHLQVFLLLCRAHAKATPQSLPFVGRLLCDLAASGSISIVLELLDRHGVDPNCAGLAERRPLIAAATAGRLDVIKALLGHGAYVWTRSKSGATAYDEAHRAGHQEVSDFLMSITISDVWRLFVCQPSASAAKVSSLPHAAAAAAAALDLHPFLRANVRDDLKLFGKLVSSFIFEEMKGSLSSLTACAQLFFPSADRSLCWVLDAYGPFCAGIGADATAAPSTGLSPSSVPLFLKKACGFCVQPGYGPAEGALSSGLPSVAVHCAKAGPQELPHKFLMEHCDLLVQLAIPLVDDDLGIAVLLLFLKAKDADADAGRESIENAANRLFPQISRLTSLFVAHLRVQQNPGLSTLSAFSKMLVSLFEGLTADGASAAAEGSSVTVRTLICALDAGLLESLWMVASSMESEDHYIAVPVLRALLGIGKDVLLRVPSTKWDSPNLYSLSIYLLRYLLAVSPVSPMLKEPISSDVRSWLAHMVDVGSSGLESPYFGTGSLISPALRSLLSLKATLKEKLRALVLPSLDERRVLSLFKVPGEPSAIAESDCYDLLGSSHRQTTTGRGFGGAMRREQQALAAKELANVSAYLTDLAARGSITIRDIVDLHTRFEFLDADVERGRFRKEITVGSFRFFESYRCFLPPEEISGGMEVYQEHLNGRDWTDELGILGALGRAYFAFAALVYFVHPFEDGNGRAARLLSVTCLRTVGLPACPISFKDKVVGLEEYIRRFITNLQHLTTMPRVGRPE